MSLWSFLRGLWPWNRRPQPSPTPRPEPAVEAAPGTREAAEPISPAVEPIPGPAASPPDEIQAAAETAGTEAEAEEADEDGGWEDEEIDDPDAPDPFITALPAESEPVDADLAARRAAAREAALSGEQRIYLSMPAGPGSLAEALEKLAAEGLVTSEFIGEGEPHILYRPAGQRP